MREDARLSPGPGNEATIYAGFFKPFRGKSPFQFSPRQTSFGRNRGNVCVGRSPMGY